MIIAAAWVLFTSLWPRLMLYMYKRAILVEGGSEGPIPINTLYTEPQALFADPLHAPVSASKLWTSGVNRDTLAAAGWLWTSGKGALIPACAGHGRPLLTAYSLLMLRKTTNFAYVGTRTTGSQAGDYLITGPGWRGQVPDGMLQISSPNNSVLVLGRTLVKSDSDLPAAYDLAKQIGLTPYNG